MIATVLIQEIAEDRKDAHIEKILQYHYQTQRHSKHLRKHTHFNTCRAVNSRPPIFTFTNPI